MEVEGEIDAVLVIWEDQQIIIDFLLVFSPSNLGVRLKGSGAQTHCQHKPQTVLCVSSDFWEV